MSTAGGDGGGEIVVYKCSESFDQNNLSWTFIENKVEEVACLSFYDDGSKYEIDITNSIKNELQSGMRKCSYALGFRTPVALYPSRTFMEGAVYREERYQCDTVEIWDLDQGYEEGSIAFFDKNVYSCKAYPFSIWCNDVAYLPGTTAGEQAWNKIGSCIPRTMTIFTSETFEESKRPKLKIQIDGTNSILNNINDNHKNIIIIKRKRKLLIPEKFKRKKLKIRNLHGQLISEFSDLQNPIDLENLSEGLFICSISDELGNYSFKLLIN